MMQQTETYQLNLIETSDAFSPAPLNENMEKVEAALGTKADAADHAALEQRVVSLEGKHIVGGVYTGSCDSDRVNVFKEIDLGFAPAFVLASRGSSKEAVLAWPDGPWHAPTNSPAMYVTENGFKVCNTAHLELNLKGKQYPFIAFD